MRELGVVSRGVCVAWLGLQVAPTLAQDLPPPAARIQRQADSPLRWIIEAGKLKSRAKAPEPVAAARPAAPKAPVRTAVAAPARTLVAAPPAAPTSSRREPTIAELPSPAAPKTDAPSTAVPLDAPVPDSAPDAPSTPPANAADPAPAALELLEGDEPALPEEIDATLDADAVLELAVVVLADGAVGDVSVVSSSHPAVNVHAVTAVRAWRFKPMAQSQTRIVELVFHPRR